jgi:hypothetical protein
MARFPELQAAALRLKHAAPREFAELLRELDRISHETRNSLVRADQAAILTVQGRAQQVDDLLLALDPPQPKQPSTPIGP